MEKIAVAQKKAHHFRAPLENPAGLRIRTESQTPDGLKYARTRFPAHLRAGIEHAGNRSYADGSSLGNLANRRFPWNASIAIGLLSLWRLAGSVRNRQPFLPGQV